ncbi:GIY-YIG nuclease family protein [Pseudoxanthomonas winnipegensis]|nr:GIY-YIG nuclease family protein [Pseudoxanthomonas winnipegensis]
MHSNYKKNLVEERHIYCLIFDNKHMYVGQTDDLKRREQEHRRPSGKWGNKKFEFVHLSTLEGTFYDAEDHEYAWRYAAQIRNWKIYGSPPNQVVNSATRMNPRRHRICKKCKFPFYMPSPYRTQWWVYAPMIMAAGAYIWHIF